MFKKKNLSLAYFAKNFSIAIGLVMIWRGLWYVLDELDLWIFGGSHIWTGLGGVVLGLVILYLPEKNLEKIENL